MSAADTPPPVARRPAPPDQDAELYAIGEAWEVMWDPRREQGITAGPLTGLLFAAVALVYESAEGDPPVCGVLHAIRATIEGWAHTHGGSTLYSSVSYADLALMVRRIDLAVALVHAGQEGAHITRETRRPERERDEALASLGREVLAHRALRSSWTDVLAENHRLRAEV